MAEFCRLSLFIASFTIITATILVRLTLSQSVNGMQSYTPVVDPVNKSALCATDPPATVVPVADVSVGVPVGVPDAVVCGLCCTGNKGCLSYNYRKSRSAPAQCELYSTVPRNCSTLASADGTCQHYEVSGLKQSCLPPVQTSNQPATTVITSTPPTTTSACPGNGFRTLLYGNNSYLFSKSQVGQPTATQICQSCGAQLTSIGSQGEYDFISGQLSTDAWIGLEKDQPNDNNQNHVHWLDGSNVAYLKWAPNNPNLLTTVCVRLTSYGFKDRTCTDVYYYVCKMPMSY